MKQFLIAIALTMSVTIGVSAQVPDRTRASETQKEFDALLERVRKSEASTSRGFARSTPRAIHTRSSMSMQSLAATGRILGVK